MPKMRYLNHVKAGHFNVFPRRFPNGFVWFWQRGDDPDQKWQGPFNKLTEAEDSALEWYESTQEK